MDYDDMLDFQRREEGDDSPSALVFDADYLAENCQSEEDWDAIGLAMDRNMAERERYWQERTREAEARAAAAEERVEELEDR